MKLTVERESFVALTTPAPFPYCDQSAAPTFYSEEDVARVLALQFVQQDVQLPVRVVDPVSLKKVLYSESEGGVFKTLGMALAFPDLNFAAVRRTARKTKVQLAVPEWASKVPHVLSFLSEPEKVRGLNLSHASEVLEDMGLNLGFCS